MLRFSIILLLLTGCGVDKNAVSTHLIPLPVDTITTVHIDSLYFVDVRYIYDSVLMRDTVIIRETKFQNKLVNNNIYIDRYKIKYLYDSVAHDIQIGQKNIDINNLKSDVQKLKDKLSNVRKNNVYLILFIIALILLSFSIKFKW